MKDEDKDTKYFVHLIILRHISTEHNHNNIQLTYNKNNNSFCLCMKRRNCKDGTFGD